MNLAKRASPVLEDEHAYLDMHFRWQMLRRMSAKARFRFLTDWAEAVAANNVIPISGARPTPGCVDRANAVLRAELPTLIKP